MAATHVSFRWLDILEKEFDKAFVDLDLLIGEVDRYELDEHSFQGEARVKLQQLSSCFAQLTHKAQTIFQVNAKLEAELIHLRHECCEGRAYRQAELIHIPIYPPTHPPPPPSTQTELIHPPIYPPTHSPHSSTIPQPIHLIPPSIHPTHPPPSTQAELIHLRHECCEGRAYRQAELIHLRHECCEGRAYRQVTQTENRELLIKLHSTQLRLHAAGGGADSDRIRERLEKDLEQQRTDSINQQLSTRESELLRKENENLRRYVLGLQGELFGARLAAKYLDKELAGRIQQMQLLLQDLRTDEHDKLWKQLDAEIHLHRHKTVVRACRGRLTHNNNNLQQQQQQQQSQAVQSSDDTTTTTTATTTTTTTTNNGLIAAASPNTHQRRRIITLHKPPQEGLGMSITGGREHGVPILVSVIHPDTPAARCANLFVGDAILTVNDISLREVSHGDAAKILSSQEGQVRLEVVYVSTDDDDDDEGEEDGDAYGFRYKIFDDDLVSVSSSSSSQQLLPLPNNNNNNNNGRLSRASVESVRGSTDNMLLDSPRRRAETETIDETTEQQHHTNGNHQHQQRQEEEEEEVEVEDRGDGGGGASSSSLNGGGVSLNGAAAAAARLVFRDGGSDNERTNTNDDDDAPTPQHPTPNTTTTTTTTETSNTATEEQQQQQEQEEEEEEGVEGSVIVGGLILKPQDLSDLSCRDLTQDSVTESSLSSPSLDESEDSIHLHHTCNTPLQDIEQKLSQNFTIVEERKREEMERRREEEEERKREEEERKREEEERKRQAERDNSPPPSPADEIFNGSY
ncbi:hypothetical protein Pcinc_041766 [Petrolisthes cinctipes]|uniref:PDZ domain-containing protein n=1 Tax=Petrolisthes cinctipes TaxID=88211 RepID=A0AAE1BJH5_PETCI|nr:hypothetical protein Pcinc_041766 [Petrolisthes cinctipes]